MPKVKIDTDIKRFVRYQSVLNALLAKDSFNKPDTYDALENEKPQFIGRVIAELVKDGYLANSGSRTKPKYSWSVKREEFNAGRWIDQRVFTPTVRVMPFSVSANIILDLRRSSSGLMALKIRCFQELFSGLRMEESLGLRTTCRNLKNS
jgi:hypothetical protein